MILEIKCINESIFIRVQMPESSRILFISKSAYFWSQLVHAIVKCLSVISRSQQNYPLFKDSRGATDRQFIVSAPSGASFNLSFIFLWKSGMASLTAGVSTQPGCITKNLPLSWCILLNSYAMQTCCLLFLAYWAVPSNSSSSMKRSLVTNFWVRSPPEAVIMILDWACRRGKQSLVRQQTVKEFVAKLFSRPSLVYSLLWSMHPALCTKISILCTFFLISSQTWSSSCFPPISPKIRKMFSFFVSSISCFTASQPL